MARNGFAIKQSEGTGGLPISRIETIAHGTIDMNRVGSAGVEATEVKGWLLEDGDILMSHINSRVHLAKCALYSEQMGPLVHGMNLLCLRADPGLALPQYLIHAFRSPQFKRQILRITNHSVNQSSFTITGLLKLEIALPSVQEQRRIAEILDRSDALKRKRKQVQKLADDFLRSVFLDRFGDPFNNPRKWPVMLIADIADGSLRNGLSPSNSGLISDKVLTLGAITSGRFLPSHCKEALFDTAARPNQRLGSKPFLICRGNGSKDLVGVGAYASSDESMTVFPDTMIAMTPSEIVQPEFFGFIWNSPFVRNLIELAARTTNGTFKINQQALEAIAIPVPSLKAQSEFAMIARANLHYQIGQTSFDNAVDQITSCLGAQLLGVSSQERSSIK